MIRLLTFQLDGTIATNKIIQEIEELPPFQDCVYWLDIFDEPAEKIQGLFSAHFHFDSLAIEDALDHIHVPKVDDWQSYLYITLPCPSQIKEINAVFSTEIDIFLGVNYLVTYHDSANEVLDSVWSNSYHNQRINKKGPVGLLYQVADKAINNFMLLIDQMDEKIEIVENDLFHDPESSLLQDIIQIKRSVLTLRRMITPFREVTNRLSRDDFNLIPDEHRMLFRDLYDHLVRLHDILENLREILGEAMDTYLSVQNNRMNDIMRILTIITTFFMPLTFLTGFFGMNFFQPTADFSNWTSKIAYIILLIGMFIFPWLMFRWMRSKKWM